MIAPGSPEWAATISPSKVATILGIGRFQSQFALWHEMAGNVSRDKATAEKQRIFDVGHAFEAALAELWRREHDGWRLSTGEIQFDRDDLGFRSLATIDRRATRQGRSAGPRTSRVVEFKTARDLTLWGDDFTDHAPHDYLVQVQWQQHIAGYTHVPAHLMVMGPFFRWHTYEIAYDPELAAQIEEACRTWMDSLASGTPPELDDTVTTYETVRQLHPDIEDRDVVVDRDLAVDYLTADADLKALTKYHRGLKTRLLDAMGQARTASTAGLKIADRRAGKHAVALYSAPKALANLIELEHTA